MWDCFLWKELVMTSKRETHWRCLRTTLSGLLEPWTLCLALPSLVYFFSFHLSCGLDCFFVFFPLFFFLVLFFSYHWTIFPHWFCFSKHCFVLHYVMLLVNSDCYTIVLASLKSQDLLTGTKTAFKCKKLYNERCTDWTSQPRFGCVDSFTAVQT